MGRLGSAQLARAALLAAGLGLAASAPATAGESAAGPWLSLDSPGADGAIGAPLGLALVSGQVHSPRERDLDLLIAIDTSHSTSGRADPHGRGWRRWLGWILGREPQTRAPSPHELGIERALALVDSLRAPGARVGVVAFAGSAWVAAPLGDPGRARAALHALRERGASGATNLIDALAHSRIELTGELGASSRPRAGARRALVLITDGVDVHPLYPDPDDARALLRESAQRIHAAGIELDVLATRTLGPITAIAEAGGRMHTDGGPLPSLAPTDPAIVSVRNASSDTDAAVSATPGGGFAALVRLVPGPNQVEIRARARSGLETSRVLDLVWNPAEPGRDLPLELLRIRNRLLATHLHSLHARARTRELSIAAEDPDTPRP